MSCGYAFFGSGIWRLYVGLTQAYLTVDYSFVSTNHD